MRSSFLWKYQDWWCTTKRIISTVLLLKKKELATILMQIDQVRDKNVVEICTLYSVQNNYFMEGNKPQNTEVWIYKMY